MNTLEALIHLKSICDKEEDCNKCAMLYHKNIEYENKCEIKKILNECVYETIPEEWKIKNKEK